LNSEKGHAGDGHGFSSGEEINIASQQEISIGQLACELIDQINPTATLKGASYLCLKIVQ